MRLWCSGGLGELGLGCECGSGLVGSAGLTCSCTELGGIVFGCQSWCYNWRILIMGAADPRWGFCF